jgi:hypothetical protein
MQPGNVAARAASTPGWARPRTGAPKSMAIAVTFNSIRDDWDLAPLLKESPGDS